MPYKIRNCVRGAGTRAAHALRPTLSELGCLPVSAMLHLPRAQEVFEDDGSLAVEADAARWASYAARGVSQLEWWGEAAKTHRARVDLRWWARPRCARRQRNATRREPAHLSSETSDDGCPYLRTCHVTCREDRGHLANHSHSTLLQASELQ